MTDSQSRDVDEILDRFRRWLESARADATADLGELDGPERPDEAAGPEFGLVDLVSEFTALRHELKLQTKGTRGLIEQSESTLAGLKQAIEQFRSVEPRESRTAWEAGKPLALALADLDESLARGRREIERISRRLPEDSVPALLEAVDERYLRQSWLRRLLTADYHRQVQNVARNAVWLRVDLLEAILEGYELIQARLARVMRSEQIERITCEGRPVDPETMLVLEVVDDPEHAPGTVVRELRSGYTWRGRLLRNAEVQAASVLSGQALMTDRSGGLHAGAAAERGEEPDIDQEDEDVGLGDEEIGLNANRGPR